MLIVPIDSVLLTFNLYFTLSCTRPSRFATTSSNRTFMAVMLSTHGGERSGGGRLMLPGDAVGNGACHSPLRARIMIALSLPCRVHPDRRYPFPGYSRPSPRCCSRRFFLRGTHHPFLFHDFEHMLILSDFLGQHKHAIRGGPSRSW